MSSIENVADRIVHTVYYFPKVQDYMLDKSVMIHCRNCFYQPFKTFIRTYNSIRKISIGQRDEYATDYLLGFIYSKENYKLIAIDLSKQKHLMQM